MSATSSQFEKMLQGDGLAYQAMVEPRLPALRRRLYSMVPSHAVEDLLQETLLHAWEKRGSLRSEEAFGGWLLQIGKRKAIDWLRRRSRQPTEAQDEGHEPESPRRESPEGRLLEKQTQALIQEALGELPPRQGAVLSMRTFSELTPNETARALEISAKTVYATEANAKARLKSNSAIKRAWELLCVLGAMMVAFLVRTQKALATAQALAAPMAAAGVVAVTAHCALTYTQNPPQKAKHIFTKRGHATPPTGAHTMKKTTLIAAVFTAATLLHTSAPKAQTPRNTRAGASAKSTTRDAKTATSPHYRKVTVFNMTGDELVGGLQKPFLLSINSRLLKKKGTLIKMRRNWKRKISRGINQL